MCALAGEDRQRVDEGVDRERGVDVQVAEQDAFGGRSLGWGERAGGVVLCVGLRVAWRIGAARALDPARIGLVAAAAEPRDERNEREREPGGAGEHGARGYWKRRVRRRDRSCGAGSAPAPAAAAACAAAPA